VHAGDFGRRKTAAQRRAALRRTLCAFPRNSSTRRQRRWRRASWRIRISARPRVYHLRGGGAQKRHGTLHSAGGLRGMLRRRWRRLADSSGPTHGVPLAFTSARAVPYCPQFGAVSGMRRRRASDAALRCGFSHCGIISGGWRACGAAGCTLAASLAARCAPLPLPRLYHVGGLRQFNPCGRAGRGREDERTCCTAFFRLLPACTFFFSPLSTTTAPLLTLSSHSSLFLPSPLCLSLSYHTLSSSERALRNGKAAALQAAAGVAAFALLCASLAALCYRLAGAAGGTAWLWTMVKTWAVRGGRASMGTDAGMLSHGVTAAREKSFQFAVA